MNPPQVILVVEDNEDDAFFMRRTLKSVASSIPTRFVSDGRKALEYLQGTGAFADRAQHPLPTVVFLDLKLPFVHGLDVLASIREDPAMKTLPVFIMTSSSEPSDRERAQRLGIQGYLVKPPTVEMLRPIFLQPA